MIRIISTIVLVLAILLFPPAVLAFVSQNALPGEGLYSIKRHLENGVLTLTSIHPVPKAWFSVAYSQRRFTEATGLIVKGENASASNSLNELVDQTNLAASQVAQISDAAFRQVLIDRLSSSIKEYDKGLETFKKQTKKPHPQASPASSPTASPTPSPSPPDKQDINDQLEQTQQELRKIQQELDTLKSQTPEASPPAINILTILDGLNSLDLSGLEETLNKTTDQYYNLLP